MGYIKSCGKCGQTWYIVNPTEVSEALSGISNLDSEIAKMKVEIENLVNFCNSEALSFSGVNLEETINNIAEKMKFIKSMAAIEKAAVAAAEAEETSKLSAYNADQARHKAEEEAAAQTAGKSSK